MVFISLNLNLTMDMQVVCEADTSFSQQPEVNHWPI